MNYLQFQFKHLSPELCDQLIALLDSCGFTGFEETDNTLFAYIPENKFEENQLKQIAKLFPKISFDKTVVENINWNKKWEENYEPIIIDDFVAIRAAFHLPVLSVQHEIVITPKMSFGTGHHATTFLMIKQMQQLDFMGKTVIDFGTGTGILAILAEKLGAKEVFAIDNDEWSIENANENIIQNGCKRINISFGSKLPGTAKADIILANITLNVISEHLPSIANITAEKAKILLSGFLETDISLIKNLLIDNNLNFLSSIKRENWASVLASVK